MRKLVSWIVLFAIYVGLVAPFAATGQITAKAMEDKLKDVPPGLVFSLSEGQEGAETRVKETLPPTDPLSDAQSDDILKRLPAIKSDASDQTDFAKRIGTLPAPKTGNKVPVKFPSDEDRALPVSDQAKTLEVIRYSPEGEVKLAPDLNVTFSQPMVAVTSQEQASQYGPVELSPQVEGRWRWLGTKTLMFDTTKRFPQATKFTVRVPAGTKSANGQTLQKDVSWTFTTPPPKVEQMFPQNETVRRNALIYLSFDQDIDPATVLGTTTVSAGGRRIQTRLATQDEIDADSTITYYAKQAQPHRWMVMRAVATDGSTENALPGASTITVTVEKGTHSGEGPLTTVAAQPFTFQTYGPMKFQGGYCGYQTNKNCSPFADWYLEFNNSVEASKFSKEMLKIEPAIDGLNIYPSGNYVYIQGYKKGRASYKVTVEGSISDIFGQQLGQPATATINVGSAEANLYAQGGYMSVMDPTAKPTFSIYSTNYSTVKVRLYAVQPTDWYQYQQYVRRINYDDDTKRPTIPGKLVYDETVAIKNVPDELVETRIDVGRGLNNGYGNVIVNVEPTVKKDKYDRTRVFTWLQATQIGLDAFVDNQELVGFATELKSGKPLNG
ncbi:MAG TPA: Ig-like domain-containing protein, partial [Pyrinomonadaceae bacterium]